jgi:hypothetical protein
VVPDRGRGDQVELARQLVREAIDFTERELGVSTLNPPSGRTLLRRLTLLRGRLGELQGVLDAVEPPSLSEDTTAQG